MNISDINDDIKQEDLIRIINYLAKLKREQGLDASQQTAQKKAYAVYLKRMRSQLDNQLDSVKIKNPDGTEVPLKDYKKDGT